MGRTLSALHSANSKTALSRDLSLGWESCLCSPFLRLKCLLMTHAGERFVLEKVPLLAATFLTGFFCTVWVL